METITNICSIENCFNKTRISNVWRGSIKKYVTVRYKNCPKHIKSKYLERRRAKRGDKYPDKNGYIWARDEDGLMFPEHRLVMEKKLNRKMINGESVHHINGIRSDNRPQNLELWLGGIRYGQRAVDVHCPHCKRPYVDSSIK